MRLSAQDARTCTLFYPHRTPRIFKYVVVRCDDDAVLARAHPATALLADEKYADRHITDHTAHWLEEMQEDGMQMYALVCDGAARGAVQPGDCVALSHVEQSEDTARVEVVDIWYRPRDNWTAWMQVDALE